MHFYYADITRSAVEITEFRDTSLFRRGDKINIPTLRFSERGGGEGGEREGNPRRHGARIRIFRIAPAMIFNGALNFPFNVYPPIFQSFCAQIL